MMNKSKRQWTRWGLGEYFLLVVIVLVIIGAVNVWSSTFYMNLRAGDSGMWHLYRHIIFIMLGMLTGLLAYWAVTFRWMQKSGMLTFLVTLTVLSLLAVLVAGVTVNGARRWIAVGVWTVQPSELAKFVAIMWSAKYLAVLHKQQHPVRLWASLMTAVKKRHIKYMWAEWKPLAVPLLFGFLVYPQPDFGTVLLIIGFPIMLYILAGLPWREVTGTVAAVAAFGAVAVMAAPYRRERLVALWDPFRHARDLGYQTVQSIIAVGSGGIFGQGAGRGHSKYAYLPEQYTDFAFSVWAQEWGFIGSAIVVLLFVALLLLGWRIASRTPHLYGRYLVYGLTGLLAGQGLYNMTMAVGSAPVTGVPLPFISYGGTSLVTCLAAVGTILGVWQINREKEARRKVLQQQEILTSGRPMRRYPSHR